MNSALLLGGPMHGEIVETDSRVIRFAEPPPISFSLDDSYWPLAPTLNTRQYTIEKLAVLGWTARVGLLDKGYGPISREQEALAFRTLIASQYQPLFRRHGWTG